MSSTCFEPKGSSTGRRLTMQLWYGMFTCIGISSPVERSACSPYCSTSSWRWTLGFETCRKKN